MFSNVSFCLLLVGTLFCLHLSQAIFNDNDSDGDFSDLPGFRKDFRPGSPRCRMDKNSLRNGIIKMRSRGRIAKFVCRIGFELVGKRFATCLRGVWNNHVPVCVAQGCPIREPPANGRQQPIYRGSVLAFYCDPGYALRGPSSIYCDGSQWNDTIPKCTVATIFPFIACNFDQDMCGWTQDPLHQFDWRRHQFSTPSGHVGTGPSFDHTLGKGFAGYYMYIETSSPNKENDTARLFSPVYPPGRLGSCFLFYYHMYGATTGALRIYIKNELQIFSELQPVKEIIGEQGNQWFRGTVDVPPSYSNYQIVIEGVKGNGYVGDTAIDDVRLVPSSNCAAVERLYPLNETKGSCELRCGEVGTESQCACHKECEATSSCCRDYWKLCVRGTSINPTILPDEEEKTSARTGMITIDSVTEARSTDAQATVSPVRNDTSVEVTLAKSPTTISPTVAFRTTTPSAPPTSPTPTSPAPTSAATTSATPTSATPTSTTPTSTATTSTATTSAATTSAMSTSSTTSSPTTRSLTTNSPTTSSPTTTSPTTTSPTTTSSVTTVPATTSTKTTSAVPTSSATTSTRTFSTTSTSPKTTSTTPTTSPTTDSWIPTTSGIFPQTLTSDEVTSSRQNGTAPPTTIKLSPPSPQTTTSSPTSIPSSTSKMSSATLTGTPITDNPNKNLTSNSPSTIVVPQQTSQTVTESTRTIPVTASVPVQNRTSKTDVVTADHKISPTSEPAISPTTALESKVQGSVTPPQKEQVKTDQESVQSTTDNDYEMGSDPPGEYPDSGEMGSPEKRIKPFPIRSKRNKHKENKTYGPVWGYVLVGLVALVIGSSASVYFLLRYRKMKVQKRLSENSDTRFLAKSEEIQFY